MSNQKIIGITGGKGGTGKSTVATALARILSERHKVLLIDADADCPNDHIILGTDPEDIKTVTSRIPEFDKFKCTGCGACKEVCNPGAIIMAPAKNPILMPRQCYGCGACKIACRNGAITWSEKEIGKLKKSEINNLTIITCELMINEPVSEKVVSAATDHLRKERHKYRYIIIDTAAGTHCDVIEALSACDITLAVTEPTPLGAHDLKLIEELLNMMQIPHEKIINRYEKGAITTTKARFRIPYSKEIIESYINSRPIRHKSIEKIARWVESL